MRTHCCAIKKVKRDVGIGFDTLQFHLYCAKKALSPNELQQILDVIAASNEERGFSLAGNVGDMSPNFGDMVFLVSAHFCVTISRH